MRINQAKYEKNRLTTYRQIGILVYCLFKKIYNTEIFMSLRERYLFAYCCFFIAFVLFAIFCIKIKEVRGVYIALFGAVFLTVFVWNKYKKKTKKKPDHFFPKLD